MRQVYLLSSLLLLFFSCQKFERNNPFDSNCPKEIWTPTAFTALQNGTLVTLSWSQPMNNISGFKFTKKVDTGSASDMPVQTKGIAQFTDAALTGGKLHTYTIVAYAGNNQSNILTATVTPKLTAGGVTTTGVSAITAFTAILGGTISTDGGSPITAKGVCWGTAASPTIAGSKTSDGTGVGTFTSTIAGLAANTTYFVRAYATNTVGITYGNEVSFKTATGISTITTANITAISVTTATGGGTISSDGGAPITARGVCWGTTTNPTTANSKTTNGTGTGSFTSTLTGLTVNTTYYIRAYATNGVGTFYGTVSSIVLYLNIPGTPITDIDGNVYKTVKIGDQTWMAENLKVTKYRNGNAIPNVTDGTTWANLTSGAYCNFGNNLTNGVTYGHLYNFYTIVDSRQLCPLGWHVPTDNEWMTLRDYLGGEKIAGGKLKEKGTAHWASPNTDSDNISGFTAFAGSWRGGDGAFYYSVGHAGWWWTSTSTSSTDAWFYYIGNSFPDIGRSSTDPYFHKQAGCSIRCIKD